MSDFLTFICTREREKVHCKCTMQCRLHFIITLFNVVKFLLCVIYQLIFTVLMYVTRMSRYIYRSVLSAVSRNRFKSWNALPVDKGVRVSLALMNCCQCGISSNSVLLTTRLQDTGCHWNTPCAFPFISDMPVYIKLHVHFGFPSAVTSG